MISHVKHDVGTEALAKKLNEIIRVMNEGVYPTNIQCDPQLLFDAVIDYGDTCVSFGGMAAMSGLYNNNYSPVKERKLAQIKGMLGLK